MTYTELNVAEQVAATLDALDAGDRVTTEQTGLLDQYHAGGVGAVDKLIPGLALSPGDTVIDIGSGFGGPARRIAEQTSAAVLGIDITPAYVEAAETLTTRMGFADRVEFRHADIIKLSVDRPYDAAVTLHVQMNVEDKAAWFAAIAGVLAPAGRLAVWEVCTTTGQQPPWPMPWSLDGSDSFLSTPADLQAAITSAGFDVVEWCDETAWVNTWSAATLGDDAPRPGLVLPMLLEAGIARVTNFSTALRDGTLTVMRGAFTKTAL